MMQRKRAAPVARELGARARRMRRVAIPARPAVPVRHGGRVDPETALPQVAAPESQLGDELLLIEMRLLSALKHRQEAASSKGKIVAALRKKR